MADWGKLHCSTVCVTPDGERYRDAAAREVSDGEVHIVCHMPEGKLEAVTAVMPLATAETEKIFLNGYQTWTYCPEYTRHDRIRGLHGVPKFLVDKYGFDRYGDYHFVDYPNKPGVLHGISYCYFRLGDRYRLIGSLDEAPGYTLFTYFAQNSTLLIERDCKGVKCSGDYHALDLFFAEGTEDEVFDAWFTAMGCKPRTTKPLAGYSSWYNRYQDITEDTIRTDLQGCKTLFQPGDLFQIDDGWEPFVGDWLEPDKKKFPNGLKPLVDEIHAAGLKAGLWLAPYVCQNDSELAKTHPDWLVRVDGKVWNLGSNWGGFCALDMDNPEVADYLCRVFDRVLNEWGFDLVKLDFLYGAALFATEQESRAGRMIRAMDFLRQLCGEKEILGCGVPVMPAFGRVEYCRISCDVSLDWDDVWYMKFFHRERVSSKQAIGNTVFRRQLNGRAYLSDPDVFFLRSENIRMTPTQKDLLAQVNGLLGSVRLTSDDPASYSDAQRKAYDAVLHLKDAENIRVDADNGIRIHYTLDGKPYVLTAAQ